MTRFHFAYDFIHGTGFMEQASNYQVPFSSKLTDLEENESIHSLTRLLHCHQVPFSCKLSDSEETVAFTHSWNRLQNHQVPFSSKLIDLEENESIHSLSRLHCHQVPFSCKLSDSEEAAFTHSWNRLQNHQVAFSSKLTDLEENESIHSLSRRSLSPGSILLQIIWFWGSCFYAFMEQASKSPFWISIFLQTNWFGGKWGSIFLN